MEEKTPPQLKGVSRNWPCYKELLCPHGKPGNGWFCPDPGCSGEGLCKHKKHKQSCKECEPAQCHLCNNGRIYAWGALSSHIYKTKMHADVPENEKAAAYDLAGTQHGYIQLLKIRD